MLTTTIEPDLTSLNEVFFTVRVCLRSSDGCLIGEEWTVVDHLEQAQFAADQLQTRLLETTEPVYAMGIMARLLAVLSGQPGRVDALAAASHTRVTDAERALVALHRVGLAVEGEDGVWHLAAPVARPESQVTVHLLIAITTVAALAALVLVDLFWGMS